MIIHNITAKAIDMLFPRRCPVCFDIVQPSGYLICPDCLLKLSPIKKPSCKKCGKEVIHERIEYCLDCTRHPRSFEYNLPVFRYNHQLPGIIQVPDVFILIQTSLFQFLSMYREKEQEDLTRQSFQQKELQSIFKYQYVKLL